MRALVTGGAGFIGSYTVDLLLAKSYQVRILDSLEPPVHPRGEKPSYLPGEAEFLQGDVRNKADLEKALEGVDVIFHMAAYQDYLPDFSRFFHVNDVGTALIYEIIVERKLPVQKVIVASSQAAYGEGKYQCPQHGVIFPPSRPLEQLQAGHWELRCPQCGLEMAPFWTDEAVVNPHNQYAISKYTQEMIALNLGRRYGIPTVAMRYSITQGSRQSFYNAYSGVCRIFTMRLLKNRPPILYEDGLQRRDYVYVGDVAEANLLVLERDEANYQVFNVGGGQTTTVAEYAHLVARTMGRELEPQVPGLFRLGDSRHIFSDIARLKALGWEPKTPLERIVAEYVAWAQEQPSLEDYYAQAEGIMREKGSLRGVTRSTR